MSTARDIIKDALRKIHVLGTGSSLDATEANDALSVLNDMLAMISAQGGFIYQETKETFNLVGNQGVYTIGTGQDFNTSPPLDIKAAFITIGSTDYSLEKYDEKEYARIAQKDISGYIGGVYYYDANHPIANIFIYPVPTTGTITLYSRKYLSSFDDLDTVYELPDYYRTMLVYNLAEWIAPEYEVMEVSPIIKRISKRSRDAVTAQNKRNNRPTSRLTGIPKRGRGGSYTGFLGGEWYY